MAVLATGLDFIFGFLDHFEELRFGVIPAIPRDQNLHRLARQGIRNEDRQTADMREPGPAMGEFLNDHRSVLACFWSRSGRIVRY